MPYIKSDDRLFYKPCIDALPHIDSAGELNYLFTEICKHYLSVNGESYQNYNDIIGALEGCKLELYARKIRPYEDSKIKANGDVYT